MADAPRSRLRVGGLLPAARLEAFSDGVFAVAITLVEGVDREKHRAG